MTAIPNTGLNARNNKGISIGFAQVRDGRTPILLNGTTISDLTLDGLRNDFIVANSINKWGTIVGTYSGISGFKRWRHGGFIYLDFPGSGRTEPLNINDNGTVVGFYAPGNGSLFDGFIYDKGQWATVDLPKAASTILVGITNAGVIIGNGYKLDGTRLPFLFENGTFKMISVPNAIPGTAT